MTEKKQWFVYIGGAVVIALLILGLGVLAGHGCSCSKPPPPVIGIDAGPGEAVIAAQLDGAVQHAAAELARIEREHAAELASFNELQRQKYDAVREGGPEAADAFIRDFNRRLRSGGSEAP